MTLPRYSRSPLDCTGFKDISMSAPSVGWPAGRTY
jgi:hypothetical protein